MYAVFFRYKFFDVKEHVGSQLNDRIATGTQRFDRFGLVAASIGRIGHPIVVFERVNGLYDRAYATYVHVDVQVVDEFGRQVWVQFCLNLYGTVDPNRRIEQNMIEQLFEQYGAVRVGQLNQKFCQFQKRLQHFYTYVFAWTLQNNQRINTYI